MDTFDRQTRSWIMRQVKSSNTSPEDLLIKVIKEAQIKGWRRNNKHIFGMPDLSFPKKKVAIFVDGCFWHGCAKCYRQPKSNIAYWTRKIKRNKIRAQEVNCMLRKLGWHVIRIWEHEIKKTPSIALRKIEKTLDMH